MWDKDRTLHQAHTHHNNEGMGDGFVSSCLHDQGRLRSLSPDLWNGFAFLGSKATPRPPLPKEGVGWIASFRSIFDHHKVDNPNLYEVETRSDHVEMVVVVVCILPCFSYQPYSFS